MLTITEIYWQIVIKVTNREKWNDETFKAMIILQTTPVRSATNSRQACVIAREWRYVPA